MADELKKALGQVLQNKGAKHFFFLYGTGKRKDGKGDGALVVAAAKPKRTEAEQLCECKEVFEGECWSTAAGDVLLFEGKSKPLSEPVLAKMVNSAKVETGKKFDFILSPASATPPAAPAAPPAPTPPPAQTAGKKVNFDEGAFRKVWPVVSKSWQTASETVDSQLEALIKAMKADDDPDMQAIADLGLNAVTGDHKVPLMAVMRDIDKASGPALQPAVAKARQIVADFRKHLNTDERVAACEDNPWDVAVKIRPTLGHALDLMDKALAAVEG